MHSDGTNNLIPPQDFMTKKQAQIALKVKRDEAAGVVTLNNILVFKNQHRDMKSDKWSVEVSNRPVKKQEGSKKSVKKKPAVILIEKFSTTKRGDWREEFQAGCQIWINHATGEVSGVCPWTVSAKDQEVPLSQIESDHAGTGSIVYDGEEFGEFMNQLDRLAEKPKVVKESHHGGHGGHK